jgi:hypothetical protein
MTETIRQPPMKIERWLFYLFGERIAGLYFISISPYNPSIINSNTVSW